MFIICTVSRLFTLNRADTVWKDAPFFFATFLLPLPPAPASAEKTINKTNSVMCLIYKNDEHIPYPTFKLICPFYPLIFTWHSDTFQNYKRDLFFYN